MLFLDSLVGLLNMCVESSAGLGLETPTYCDL